LPNQRGDFLESGRNWPMYTWFRLVPRTFTLTGSATEANTEFTDCTSWKIWRSASSSAAVDDVSLMAK
jgi:hypothetical protein